MPESGAVASVTARRVAAYRLGVERVPSPRDGGNPDADDRLAADVAAGVSVDRASHMARYIGSRTRFFDRVTVNALEREVGQIVVIGAGYDGRALRYHSPGVRWWEIDRPATQADKRSRLSRLGIATEAVTFVALDLAGGTLAPALLGTGFEPDAPALYLFEGVAAYLEAATLRQTLRDLRSLATPGTRLAISLGRCDGDPSARARFETNVAALGEPALGSIGADDAEEALADCRWRTVELKSRSKAAGFVMAAPVFAPADPDVPATVGRIGTFVETMLFRRGDRTLGYHLEATYGVPVMKTKELDLGVHRVERADGSTWIARVFPATRALADVAADGELLRWLDGEGIPAERPAAADPVTSYDGQGVLVTRFAPGRRPAAGPALYEELGRLLARIHLLPAGTTPANRAGGAWHHLILDASVADELAAARRLLDAARHRVPSGLSTDYDRLVEAIDGLLLPADLPTSVVHPDFVLRNLIRGRDDCLTIVDWTGAGLGPRVVSLGCLLWSAAGHGPSVEAAARGYGSALALHSDELRHLETAMTVRPAVLACWTFATGRSSVTEAGTWWSDQHRRLAKAAVRAAAVLG